MAAPKRNKLQKEKDRELIVQWLIEGLSQEQIAEKLNISQQQISYDLKIIQHQWKQQTAIDFDKYKARILAEIALAKKKAWEGWNRSCEEFKSRSISAKPVQVRDDKGNVITESLKPTSQTIHTETRVGDPRFLAEINRLIERECKLLGLDAPERIDGNGVIVIDCAPCRGVDMDEL
jgi:hypothetical protein